MRPPHPGPRAFEDVPTPALCRGGGRQAECGGCGERYSFITLGSSPEQPPHAGTSGVVGGHQAGPPAGGAQVSNTAFERGCGLTVPTAGRSRVRPARVRLVRACGPHVRPWSAWSEGAASVQGSGKLVAGVGVCVRVCTCIPAPVASGSSRRDVGFVSSWKQRPQDCRPWAPATTT